MRKSWGQVIPKSFKTLSKLQSYAGLKVVWKAKWSCFVLDENSPITIRKAILT